MLTLHCPARAAVPAGRTCGRGRHAATCGGHSAQAEARAFSAVREVVAVSGRASAASGRPQTWWSPGGDSPCGFPGLTVHALPRGGPASGGNVVAPVAVPSLHPRSRVVLQPRRRPTPATSRFNLQCLRYRAPAAPTHLPPCLPPRQLESWSLRSRALWNSMLRISGYWCWVSMSANRATTSAGSGLSPGLALRYTLTTVPAASMTAVPPSGSTLSVGRLSRP